MCWDRKGGWREVRYLLFSSQVKIQSFNKTLTQNFFTPAQYHTQKYLPSKGPYKHCDISTQEKRASNTSNREHARTRANTRKHTQTHASTRTHANIRKHDNTFKQHSLLKKHSNMRLVIKRSALTKKKGKKV